MLVDREAAPSRKRGTEIALVCIAAATAAVSALFMAFPGLDLAISRLFFYPSQKGFPLGWRPPLTYLRSAGTIAVAGVVTVLLAGMVVKLLRPERPSPIPPRATSFLLWSLALGPGLLVNLLFKNLWGRPRPETIEAFGGTLPFVPPWHISSYCLDNCSFVSGEASSAIWLTAIALVVPAGWRLATFVVTLLFAAAVSFNRIAFGGHFTSDVLIAWGLTAIVILLVYRVLYVRTPRALTDPVLEAALTRFAYALRGRRVPSTESAGGGRATGADEA